MSRIQLGNGCSAESVRCYSFKAVAPMRIGGGLPADDRRRQASPAPEADPGEKLLDLARRYCFENPSVTLSAAIKAVSELSAEGHEAHKAYNAACRPSAATTKSYSQERTDGAAEFRSAEAVVANRCRELLDTGKAATYRDAVVKVFASDPQLAARYNAAQRHGAPRGRNPSSEI